jgi:hypothetical protein
MCAAPTKPPRRRKFRFTLRTLFIAVTILCCWLGWKVNAARKQHDAVEAIRRSAVGDYWELRYDYQNRMPYKPQPEPHWLANYLGVDLLHDVVGVSAQGVDRKALPHLTNLPQLQVLAISGSSFADEDCKYLVGLTNLTTLNLEFDALTDEGLAKLRGLKNLQCLCLTGNRALTDAGMENLKHWPSLHILRIGRCEITNAGLSHLKDLPQLETLLLIGTRVDDRGLNQLAALPNLKLVRLEDTKVTKAGVEQFRKRRPEVCVDWHGEEEQEETESTE